VQVLEQGRCGRQGPCPGAEQGVAMFDSSRDNDAAVIPPAGDTIWPGYPTTQALTDTSGGFARIYGPRGRKYARQVQQRPQSGPPGPTLFPHFRHRRSLSDRRRSVFILGPHQAGRQTTASGPSTPIQPAEKQQARGSSPLASSQFPKESSRSWRSVTARELDDANPREPKHRGASGATRRDGSSVYTVVPKERERERDTSSGC
jgi:hypothetical protein